MKSLFQSALLTTSLIILYKLFIVESYSVDMKKNISNVVISIAMEDEASPIINKLGLQFDDSMFPPSVPFRAFRGWYEKCQITLVTNGQDTVYGTGVDNVGTVPASLATYLILQKLNGTADIVVNAGTCGGFQRKGAQIGDVYLTSAVANHDRRIPIPEFISYGVGRLNAANVSQLAASINAKIGVCTTSNSLDFHSVDMTQMENNGASVKDMEAAAIAWSCALHKTPYFGIKVVTDIVDGNRPTQEEFMENLYKAAHSLQEALPQVLQYVCSHSHDEL